jgi:hypothetical protein
MSVSDNDQAKIHASDSGKLKRHDILDLVGKIIILISAGVQLLLIQPISAEKQNRKLETVATAVVGLQKSVVKLQQALLPAAQPKGAGAKEDLEKLPPEELEQLGKEIGEAIAEAMRQLMGSVIEEIGNDIFDRVAPWFTYSNFLLFVIGSLITLRAQVLKAKEPKIP